MGALALLVAAELARQALGPDALLIIDNIVRHEAPPPRAAPAIVRELLARPLDAANAAAFFDRNVNKSLMQFAAEPEKTVPFDSLLQRYIEELAAAQRALLAATGKLDEQALLEALKEGLPSADQLLGVANAVDPAGLERANALLVEATAKFVRDLDRNVAMEPRRLETAIGTVVIGSRGSDRHYPGAALIIDPGGDDTYVRAPAFGGAISVIVDLGGDDRYLGADIAVRALSALIDLAGDDRYDTEGPGLGAAIAGASLLVDLAGNDRYQSGYFGQGAAAFGTGALIDIAGDDEYRLVAWGQGLGLAGGLGLLWDRGGSDHYLVAGAADPFNRGLLSGAQGAGFGFRTLLGGGIGILRDDRGDDRYEAEMFAQGSGYYYGAGLLWDESGHDRYRAVRYAQGSGAHEAVGVLRDEEGFDSYDLGHGAGQGMGLDLALGVLVDGAGDDRYSARFHAQGTATANGLGLLADAGGADRLRVEDRYAWGTAEPLRGLPSVGLLLNDSRKALFERMQPAAAKPPPSAIPFECAKADLSARRDDFDVLLAAGQALHCALRKGERWDEAAALLRHNPADPLATWIAPALPAAPEALREELRAVLWAHPSCGVRTNVLTKEKLEDALSSSCWRLLAAALRLGAKPAPGVRLPGFLPAPRAY
ncbi:MAG: hypothetical protein K0S03_1616 [Burkholderiales bacterium]|nr:hypothetical protein [Burkholderiales bacterium]